MTPDAWRLDGYDVSHWNVDRTGRFPWSQSRDAGHRLAAFKGGTGNHGIDEQYIYNRVTTLNKGFEYRTIYWWQLPHTQESLESQVAWWVGNMGDLTVGECIEVDQENPVTPLDLAECRAALDMLQAHYPNRDVHYGFGSYANRLHYNLKPYWWWRASPTNLPPDDSVVVLQYGQENVPGVGLVDCNQIINEDALRKLCGYGGNVIDRLANRLTQEVGYVEGQGNITKYAAELDAVENPKLPRQGSPWCGTFQDWGAWKEGITLPVQNFWTPGAARWYHDHGQWSQASPQRGDYAYLNRLGVHGHVGFVLEVQGANVRTVEGNTTTSAAGSQANGGEVALKTRPISFWQGGFGRPNYGTDNPAPVKEVNVIRFVRLDGTDPVWLSSNAATLTWIQSQEDLAAKKYILGWSPDEPDHVVASKTDLYRWGVPVGPLPPGWVA